MPLAGMGYGAAKTLEDLVAEQMLRQKLAAEIKAREDALSEQRRSSMADEAARGRQLDLSERQLTSAEADRERIRQAQEAAAAQASAQRNALGDMVAVSQMPGMTPEAKRGEMAGSAARTGMKDVPNYVSALVPTPKTFKVTTVGATGQPIEKLATEEELSRGVPGYREPKTPEKPTYIQYTDENGNLQVATPDEIRRMGGVKTQPKTGGLGSAPMQLRAQRTASALNSVEKLKELVPKRTPGPAGILQGMAQKVEGLAGYNTKVRQYEALLGPTAMQMAVAIQGAANLSDTERETMKNMLGSISTMDYETQVALLDNAAELLRTNGAGVSQQTIRDAQTGIAKKVWVPVAAGPMQADVPAVTAPTRLRFDAKGNPIP